MSIPKVVEILCAESSSICPFHRAINLFGFQAAILAPGHPGFVRNAHVLAAVKILQHIEQEIASTSDFYKNLDDPRYRTVLPLVFSEGGAWRLGQMGTMKDFWQQIVHRLREVSDIACLVEFSHRFAHHGEQKPRQLGGITMATHFVEKAEKISEGTLKNRRRDYATHAVFQYLMLRYHRNFKPKKLIGKNFATRLLHQAADIASTRNFFADYAALKKCLAPRGYKFVDLSQSFYVPKRAEIVTEPFNAREIKIIQSYGRR